MEENNVSSFTQHDDDEKTLTIEIGEFTVGMNCLGDFWVDEGSERIAEYDRFEIVAEQKRQEKIAKKEVKTAAQTCFETLQDNVLASHESYWQFINRMSSATKRETNSKGEVSFVLDTRQIYASMFIEDYQDLIDPENDKQEPHRQFANYALKLYRGLFDGDADEVLSKMEAACYELNPITRNLHVGWKLEKTSSGNVSIRQRALAYMTKR